MYHEFLFSLGLSGHSLFNVHTESILLCYWMINQESRQRVPLHSHLLLVQQQCSSATYTKVRSRIIELNLFYPTIYAGKWSCMLILNFSAYGLKIVSCTPLVYTWSTQDHQPDGSSEILPWCIKSILDHLVEFSFTFAGATRENMKLKLRNQMNAYPPCPW